jgi:uncharacterized protein
MNACKVQKRNFVLCASLYVGAIAVSESLGRSVLPMRKALVASALLLLHLVPTIAHAASFDCKKARTQVEKTICADAELSQLDEELTSAYRDAMGKAVQSDKDTIRKEQADWLNNRNKVCGSIPGRGRTEPDGVCLKTAYEYRIWKLAPARDESNPLRAGRYRVGWGWDLPLCQELSAHLNRHPEWPPLSCGMRVGTSDPNFALPAWEALDIREHRAMLKSIWDEGRTPVSLIRKPESDRIFEERFEARSFKLARAVFDVNSSGQLLTVYRAELNACSPNDEFGFNAPMVPKLYAVGPDGKRPQDDSFAMLSSPPRDVFLYKGRTHLTWWFGRLAQGSASLGVYENVSPRKVDFGATPVCTLGFRR